MWHVEDVRDVILIVFVCNAIYVKDVEDRLTSSTYIALQPLGVFDLSSTSLTYIALQPLGVMLCMLKMLKIGKEHTDTFLS